MTNKFLQVTTLDNCQLPKEDLTTHNLNGDSFYKERHPVSRHNEETSVVYIPMCRKTLYVIGI